MKIVRFEIKTIQIPLRTPFITALRRVDFVESVRLFIYSDDNKVGIGEAPPTEAITGENTKSIISTICDTIMPQLLHIDFHDIDVLFKRLHASCKGHTSAKAAVDIALYELLSHQDGLAHYLGVQTNTLQTDITISLNAPSIMAADAKRAYSEGFCILKVKVGKKDNFDFERIKSVCEAVPEATILLDVNQAWEREEAKSMIKKLTFTNIALIEQPLIAKDLEGMQAVTSHSSIPILADESAFNLQEVKNIIHTKSAHMINIKLMKCGGIYKALEIIHYCKKKRIKCMMGSMLEGPYSIRAAMLLALAYPELFIYCDLDSPGLYKTLPNDAPFTIQKATLSLV